jgi:uncharacterized membrane protein
MDWFPITSSTGVLAALSGVCAFFFWLEKLTKWKFFQFVPPLIFIYLLPMIFANNGVLPAKSPVYDTMGTILLPMMLVLLLLKLNIRSVIPVLGRGLGVMLFGTLGVMVGAPIGLLAVKQWLGPDAWKAFGSLSGSWVGGSANLVAVSQMVNASGTEYGLAVLADTLITYAIWLPILIASKKYAEPFARFARVKPIDSAEPEDDDAHVEHSPAPTTRDYIFLIFIGLFATWFANAAANWIQPPAAASVVTASGATAGLPSSAPVAQVATPTSEAPPKKTSYVSTDTWRILLITTIGIALSFTPLSRIAGSYELAMALLYLLVARMGATAQLEGIASQAIPFLIGAVIWIFIHGVFCLLGAAIFRTDIHTAAIASAANIGGAASSTIVASYHKRSLIPAAILMALIGYAIGNYTGYITALMCHYVDGGEQSEPEKQTKSAEPTSDVTLRTTSHSRGSHWAHATRGRLHCIAASDARIDNSQAAGSGTWDDDKSGELPGHELLKGCRKCSLQTA